LDSEIEVDASNNKRGKRRVEYFTFSRKEGKRRGKQQWKKKRMLKGGGAGQKHDDVRAYRPNRPPVKPFPVRKRGRGAGLDFLH